MSFYTNLLPELRRGALRRKLAAGENLRLIEAHSGLSAIIGGNARLTAKDRLLEFDGLWLSSLTSSAARGLPDMEMYLFERRLELIEEIINAVEKPAIVDGDTGGSATALEYLCRRLEAMGVSAVVIEDKQQPKRNSLSAAGGHVLEDPNAFGAKIARAKRMIRSPDFMIFARIESLIAGESVADALARTRIYVDSGVDGIMIHSRSRSRDAICAFLGGYAELFDDAAHRPPVMCVPTTYNAMTAQELFDRGARIVIHANHLLRAAIFAMQRVCEDILRNDRTLEVDNICTPVAELFRLVGYDDALKRDAETSARQKVGTP
jgi:phosphoenolpyruvate phosphomutase